jgi:hypothetical protein
MARRAADEADSSDQQTPTTHDQLMERHAVARRQRDAAALGSPEFRAAAEEVARIEIAIAALREPTPRLPESP